MVAVASRPDLVAAGDVVRRELLRTVAIAIAVGLLLGTLLAVLLTSRIRRIGRAAARIEGGSFDEPLHHTFNDELGVLAGAIDSMRLRLRDSFATLEGERDRLRSLLEQLQEGVIAFDRDLRVVFANSRAALMIGRRVLAEGAPLPEPWPGASLRHIAERLFKPGATVANERVSPDSQHTYSVAGIPARADASSALLVITDITAVERRERAEREFVANAAHELRTPIAAIASAVEVLQEGAEEDPEERARFLALVKRQSDRLGRLVRALLTLARAQTRAEVIRLEPVAVGPLLEEIAGELADHPEAEVRTQWEGDLLAYGHRDLLAQAIGNLVTNAVKHGGRSVTLSAAASSRDRIRIEVRDDGPGIPPAERDRVFDRFYRGADRSAAGFGLGLPIVQEVVAAIGGRVELETTEDGGTVATIDVASAGAAR